MKSDKIGMVITAFKIGPVLVDTIQNLLDQQDTNLVGLVIVVDGCPYTNSTRSICRRYARAYPGLVHFLWLENGGVSRARNKGVEFLREQHSDLAGIFLLDGDDLLTPNSAASSLKTLQDADADGTRAGWVYCDQVQFGHDAASLKYPRKFRPTRWLGSNLSQPSCLISNKMFDDGVFWDEDMRQGIEDWEYWYTAIESDFEGVSNPDAYLRYRRLTGNRSSLNRAKDAITKDYMRNKHSDLMSLENFQADELDNFPRWAFSSADGTWKVGSRPAQSNKEVTAKAFAEAMSYRFSQDFKSAYIFDPYFPDMVAFINADDQAILEKHSLLEHVLFEAELALQDRAICLLDLENADPDVDDLPRHSIKIKSETESLTGEDYTSASFFICLQKLENIFDDSAKSIFYPLTDNDENIVSQIENVDDHDTAAKSSVGEWLRDLFKHRPSAENATEVSQFQNSTDLVETYLRKERGITRLSITVPNVIEPHASSCFEDLCEFTQLFLQHAYHPTAPSKLYRPRHFHCGRDKANHQGLGKELFGIWPVMALPKSDAKTDIALIIPDGATAHFNAFCQKLIAENDAKSLRLHIFSLGETVSSDFGKLEKHVSSRTALNLKAEDWTPHANANYFGVPLYERVEQYHQDRFIGRMMNMDMVINFAGPIVSGPILRLKKAGVETSLFFDAQLDQEGFSHLYSRGGLKCLPIDPLAVQAYTGAYKNVWVLNENNSLRLQAVGVPKFMIQNSSKPTSMIRSHTHAKALVN